MATVADLPDAATFTAAIVPVLGLLFLIEFSARRVVRYIKEATQ